MPVSVLDDYLQQLHDEGELDSRGQITLDPARAREKLATSRFLHAAEAILAVVGAALLAQSQWVRILRHGNRLVILSTQGLQSPEDLRDLFTGMFTPGQPAPAKELALALNSLFPRHCEAVRVELLLREDRLHVGQFRNAEWVVNEEMLPKDWCDELRQRITLVRPPPWKRPWEWLQTRVRGLDDLNVLRSRTRWCPVPVEFQAGNGFKSSWEMDPPEFPADALVSLHVESHSHVLSLPDYLQRPADVFHWSLRSRGRTSMRGGLLLEAGDLSTVTIVYRGLTMARHQFRSRLLPFEGVINTQVLDLDASRQQIVNNNRLWNLTGQIRTWIAQATAAWLEQLRNEQLTPLLRQRLLALLAGLQAVKKDEAVFQSLAHLRFLPVRDGSQLLYLSWKELDELVERFDGVHTVNAREAVWLHGRPVVPSWQPHWNVLIRRRNWRRVDSHRLVHYDASRWRYRAELAGQTLLAFSLQLSQASEASLYLPARFEENWISIAWAGRPYDHVEEPLFRHFPQSLKIYVDGEFRYPFDQATRQLLGELRQAVWEQCGELLQQLVSAGIQHPQHFCSLLRIWQTQSKKRQRSLSELPPAVLDYPMERDMFTTVTLRTLLEQADKDWRERLSEEWQVPIGWLRPE